MGCLAATGRLSWPACGSSCRQGGRIESLSVRPAGSALGGPILSSGSGPERARTRSLRSLLTLLTSYMSFAELPVLYQSRSAPRRWVLSPASRGAMRVFFQTGRLSALSNTRSGAAIAIANATERTCRSCRSKRHPPVEHLRGQLGGERCNASSAWPEHVAAYILWRDLPESLGQQPGRVGPFGPIGPCRWVEPCAHEHLKWLQESRPRHRR